MIAVIKDLSPEQLNEIPEGFKNNIIWNVAHMIAAQQGVCYGRGGHSMVIEEEIFDRYKPETVPEFFVDESNIKKVTQLLLSTIEILEVDYNAGLFKNNPPWVNRYGINLENIDDTINFLLVHDGLHLGFVNALIKVV